MSDAQSDKKRFLMIFAVALTILLAALPILARLHMRRLDRLSIERQEFKKTVFETQGSLMSAETRAELEAFDAVLNRRSQDRRRIQRRLNVVGFTVALLLTIVAWWSALRS